MPFWTFFFGGASLPKNESKLSFSSAPTSVELRSRLAKSTSQKLRPKGLIFCGGSDETRTRDLCRDRAAL